MSQRLVRTLLAAAVLVGAAGLSRADQPRLPKVEDDRPGQESVLPEHGSLMIGIDCRGNVRVEVTPAEGETQSKNVRFWLPFACTCPCMGPLFGLPTQALLSYCTEQAPDDDDQSELDPLRLCEPDPPVDEEGGDDPDQVKDLPPVADKPAPEEVTCPYLKKQAEDMKRKRVEGPCPAGSVVENLEALEHARRLLRLASYYRRSGHPETARVLYRQVQRLCPGSRLDRTAGACLRRMAEPGVARRPGREEARPLRRVTPTSLPDANEEPQEAPMPQRRQPKRTRAAVEKRVGKLLEACHKALLAGSYGKAQDLARKALQLNAACVAAHPLVYKFDLLHRLEEQAPRLEIRRVGFEERMPDLEGVAADRSTDAAAFLRDVLDAFCGGACLDIDCSTTDGFRAQCGLQAGGVELKLIVTDGGPSSAVLHLLPGADGEPWNAPTQADQRNGEWIPPVIEDGEGPPPLPPLPPVPADEGETDLPGVDR